jgi:hypothetical protein
MAAWQWLVDSAGVVLLLVLGYGLLLVGRRRWLSREGGTFELSVRVRTSRMASRGWVLGLGRYDDDALEWFRIFTLWPRPTRRWRRGDLRFVSQREPSGPESFSLYAGHVVVVCATPAGQMELAMSRAALTGLQSWLEAAPPGDPAVKKR